MTKRSQSHPFRKDGYLTITQIAKIIDITPSQIYDRINNGSIKIKQINDSTKIKYLFKDVPETIDLFKNLFEGKLKTSMSVPEALFARTNYSIRARN